PARTGGKQMLPGLWLGLKTADGKVPIERVKAFHIAIPGCPVLRLGLIKGKSALQVPLEFLKRKCDVGELQAAKMIQQLQSGHAAPRPAGLGVSRVAHDHILPRKKRKSNETWGTKVTEEELEVASVCQAAR